MSLGYHGGRAPLVYDDRPDLPKGYVLVAFDGHLSVRDGGGVECATLSFRRERWVWRAAGTDGFVMRGIAPTPADAWRMILEIV